MSNYEKVAFSAADLEIRALLADPGVDDDAKDVILRRGVAEIRATWQPRVWRQRERWAVMRARILPIGRNE